MIIGIIYEDYHSEVIDFLIELIENELNGNIIIYNKRDSYNNLELYLKKYRKVSKRKIKDFERDLNKGVCDKIIVITYTNLYSLEYWEKYKDKTIFIAHDSEQKKRLEEYGYEYFTLTHLLSENERYMLPITKKENRLINASEYKENQVGNLIPILIIGHLMDTNRDTLLIKELLRSNKVYFFIFIPMETDVISELKKINNNFYYEIKSETNKIEDMITRHKIRYLLFAPLENSNYYKSQWSGSIAFGINRNMTLIIPKEIDEIYDLKSVAITYNKNESVEKTINNLESKDTANYREKIYNKNKEKIKSILK
jgi:hypothetical protein